jgi:hypothetical protein
VENNCTRSTGFRIAGTRLSNLSILSVHDEGYPRNASRALNLISTFLLTQINYKHQCSILSTRNNIKQALRQKIEDTKGILV